MSRCDPNHRVGYFCPRNGIQPDEDWYRRVIESEIVPLIQEVLVRRRAKGERATIGAAGVTVAAPELSWATVL